MFFSENLSSAEKEVAEAMKDLAIDFARENCPQHVARLEGFTEGAWQMILYGVAVGISTMGEAVDGDPGPARKLLDLMRKAHADKDKNQRTLKFTNDEEEDKPPKPNFNPVFLISTGQKRLVTALGTTIDLKCIREGKVVYQAVHDDDPNEKTCSFEDWYRMMNGGCTLP